MDEEKEEVFVFLDELRDSGDTNMYAARPYIVEEFGYTRREAGVILKE